jgi:hypothetical protein
MIRVRGPRWSHHHVIPSPSGKTMRTDRYDLWQVLTTVTNLIESHLHLRPQHFYDRPSRVWGIGVRESNYVSKAPSRHHMVHSKQTAKPDWRAAAGRCSTGKAQSADGRGDGETNDRVRGAGLWMETTVPCSQRLRLSSAHHCSCSVGGRQAVLRVACLQYRGQTRNRRPQSAASAANCRPSPEGSGGGGGSGSCSATE